MHINDRHINDRHIYDLHIYDPADAVVYRHLTGQVDEHGSRPVAAAGRTGTPEHGRPHRAAGHAASSPTPGSREAAGE